MSQLPSFLADGIAAIGNHNGVHRIVLYKLTTGQQAEHTVELLIPDRALEGFVSALMRLRAEPKPEAAEAAGS